MAAVYCRKCCILTDSNRDFCQKCGVADPGELKFASVGTVVLGSFGGLAFAGFFLVMLLSYWHRWEKYFLERPKTSTLSGLQDEIAMIATMGVFFVGWLMGYLILRNLAKTA